MKHNKKKAYPSIEVSDEEWNYFSSKFEYFEFRKGTKLLEQGATEKHLTFLEEGILRCFLFTDNKDRTLRFVFPENFVSGYSSFILQKPSNICIEALSDVKCWRISYPDLQHCYSRSLEINKLGRISAELLYVLSSAREISMLSKSPQERYLKLLNTNPEWFQHIPLKHVASYLGITPQALSRIRARIF